MVAEKNLVWTYYNEACNAYVWRTHRVTALQSILDAAMEKERVNYEAMESHAIRKMINENEERQLSARFGIVDKLQMPQPACQPAREDCRTLAVPERKRPRIESSQSACSEMVPRMAMCSWSTCNKWGALWCTRCDDCKAD